MKTPTSRLIAVNPEYFWLETFSWYTCTCLYLALVGSNYLVGCGMIAQKVNWWKNPPLETTVHIHVTRTWLSQTEYCVHMTRHMWQCRRNQPDIIFKRFGQLNFFQPTFTLWRWFWFDDRFFSRWWLRNVVWNWVVASPPTCNTGHKPRRTAIKITLLWNV